MSLPRVCDQKLEIEARVGQCLQLLQMCSTVEVHKQLLNKDRGRL